MTKPIHIDGAFGEGGGQILRSSLALSLVTGRPFRIEHIRAGRSRPGLRKQHLAAVRAAAAVGRARVTGDALGSCELEFHPEGVFAGHYTFDVGSAGSCGLVAQTILPPLITADRPSRLDLIGGTHNPFAPPFHFLERVFLPLIGRMGPRLQAGLQAWGFYPVGGGRMSIDISPVAQLSPLNLTERGEPLDGRLRAVVCGLPRHIAQRECQAFDAAATRRFDCSVEELSASAGPGNVLLAEIESTHVTELFSAFGRRGVPAEKVGRQAADQVNAYLLSAAPVGPYLADQLLIPSAMAGRGIYRTGPPTRHTRTNLAVARQFFETPICLRRIGTAVWEIEIGTTG